MRFPLFLCAGVSLVLGAFVTVIVYVVRETWQGEVMLDCLDEANACPRCATRWIRPGWEVEITYCAEHKRPGQARTRMVFDSIGHPETIVHQDI